MRQSGGIKGLNPIINALKLELDKSNDKYETQLLENAIKWLDRAQSTYRTLQNYREFINSAEHVVILDNRGNLKLATNVDLFKLAVAKEDLEQNGSNTSDDDTGLGRLNKFIRSLVGKELDEGDRKKTIIEQIVSKRST